MCKKKFYSRNSINHLKFKIIVGYTLYNAAKKKSPQNFEWVNGFLQKALTTGTGFFALTKTQVLEKSSEMNTLLIHC